MDQAFKMIGGAGNIIKIFKKFDKNGDGQVFCQILKLAFLGK